MRKTRGWSCVAGLLMLAPAVGQAQAPKPRAAASQNAVTEKRSTAPAVDPFVVPNVNTADKLIDFVEKVQAVAPSAKTREEFVAFVSKQQAAIITATGRALKDPHATEDEAVAAAEYHLAAHFLRARVGIDGALEQTLAAARALAKDARPQVAAHADEVGMLVGIQNFGILNDAEQKAVLNEVLGRLPASNYSEESLQLAGMLGETLERNAPPQLAVATMKKISAALQQTDEPAAREMNEHFAGKLRRLQLPGRLMELSGRTTSGKPLDWESYRGKVVLVDFWSTTCGICVAELPNLKELYEQYHDRGFEVVGISLDKDPRVVDRFIQQQQVPWVQMFEAEKELQGWEHPMARYYGVSALPTVLLLDRQGKVVMLDARGEALANALEELFGPADGRRIVPVENRAPAGKVRLP